MHSHETAVELSGSKGNLVIQGFRAGEGEDAYVFLGLQDGDSDLFSEYVLLDTTDAHIISEEIRKHAEFAQSVREQENE